MRQQNQHKRVAKESRCAFKAPFQVCHCWHVYSLHTSTEYRHIIPERQRKSVQQFELLQQTLSLQATTEYDIVVFNYSQYSVYRKVHGEAHRLYNHNKREEVTSHISNLCKCTGVNVLIVILQIMPCIIVVQVT